MSGSEGDGYKSQGRARARPLLLLCSSVESFSCAVQQEVFSVRERDHSCLVNVLLSWCAMQGFWARVFIRVFHCCFIHVHASVRH